MCPQESVDADYLHEVDRMRDRLGCEPDDRFKAVAKLEVRTCVHSYIFAIFCKFLKIEFGKFVAFANKFILVAVLPICRAGSDNPLTFSFIPLVSVGYFIKISGKVAG